MQRKQVHIHKVLRVQKSIFGGKHLVACSPPPLSYNPCVLYFDVFWSVFLECSSAAPSAGKEWEEYVQIRALVEKIRKKQKGVSVVFEGSREDYFPELMSWAAECGASCDGFEISSFADEGYGLKATRDIKAEELFLWIPRKMLMTVESAKNSVLGEFGRIADPEFNLKLISVVTDSDAPLYFRWAVSSVMTRQNQIPTEDGSRVTLALIPLWDMCNHTNGLVSTHAHTHTHTN
uniref:SET domain containing 3, actin histidine methyltransferase n=1 Tax=Astyanax mexicanus TaxID=7994 RepID=A0A8B9GTX3_ASTMX